MRCFHGQSRTVPHGLQRVNAKKCPSENQSRGPVKETKFMNAEHVDPTAKCKSTGRRNARTTCGSRPAPRCSFSLLFCSRLGLGRAPWAYLVPLQASRNSVQFLYCVASTGSWSFSPVDNVLRSAVIFLPVAVVLKEPILWFLKSLRPKALRRAMHTPRLSPGPQPA